jgi:hypothetical protein
VELEQAMPAHDRLSEQSSAASLREDARSRSLRSLSFFLSTVVKAPGVSEELCTQLQALGLRRLLLLLAGTTLWCKLQKPKKQMQPVDPATQDAVRWLFPEVRENARGE